MSNPFFIFTRKELIYLIVIFILGNIIGATLLNIYVSQRIDKLILEKNTLINKCEEQENQINKLKENLQKQKRDFIQQLTVKLDSDLNKHTQQEIIKKIKELLNKIIGKELNKLDPLLLRDITHNRYIIVEGKTYQLKLLYTVLAKNLELYIKINSYSNGQENE